MTNAIFRYFKKGLLFLIVNAIILFFLQSFGFILLTRRGLILENFGTILLLYLIAIIIINGFVIELVNRWVRN